MMVPNDKHFFQVDSTTRRVKLAPGQQELWSKSASVYSSTTHESHQDLGFSLITDYNRNKKEADS